MAESPQKVKYNELILEKDKKGRTVVEVDQSLVRRLKPHQVNNEKPSSAQSNAYNWQNVFNSGFAKHQK